MYLGGFAIKAYIVTPPSLVSTIRCQP